MSAIESKIPSVHIYGMLDINNAPIVAKEYNAKQKYRIDATVEALSDAWVKL